MNQYERIAAAALQGNTPDPMPEHVYVVTLYTEDDAKTHARYKLVGASADATTHCAGLGYSPSAYEVYADEGVTDYFTHDGNLLASIEKVELR
jgi:hypothetical protein